MTKVYAIGHALKNSNVFVFSFGVQRWLCVFMRPEQVVRPIGAMNTLRNSKVKHKFIVYWLGVVLGVEVVIA